MNMWGLVSVANAVVAVCYGVIGIVILRGLVTDGEWRRNTLALNTAGIFFSCSAGHGVHLWYLLADSGGTHHGGVVDVAFGGWALLIVDGITAVIAVSFLVQRLRHENAVANNRLYDDLRERRQTAMDLNDDVIQGLVTAKLALDLGDTEEAQLYLERTLAASRNLVGQLLEPTVAAGRVRPGDLRRRAAAEVR